MQVITHRFFWILLTVTLLTGLTVQPGYGIWQVLLDEDFNKDQQIQQLRWPWNTPPQNPNIRWYYNARPPYPRTLPEYTDYSWGLQNYIYNVLARRFSDNHASIWCAYTNQGDIQRPRWPADVDYMNNQNAWTWWGPFDLRRATNAAVVFWYWLDVTYGSQDSLSVVVSPTDANMTLNGSNFRTRLAFGAYYDNDGNEYRTIFNSRPQDWQRRQFYLNDLRLLNANGTVRDTVVSYCKRTVRVGDRDSVIAGQRTCYLAFVWQSNDRVISGKGAFIDDVMVLWDDGLFDLHPVGAELGVRVNEDSIHWMSSYTPRMDDSVYFKMKWRVVGDGQTPEFTIRCLLDGELFYTENRVGAAIDSTFESVADRMYYVTPGEHVVRWEIDTGGTVEESNENNNFIEYIFSVEWNPPPEFQIFTPDRDSTLAYSDSTYRIFFTISDSNETDQTFTAYIYFTSDTTGLAASPELVYDYNYIGHSFRAPRGDSDFRWNLPADWSRGNVQQGELLYICGFATDGYPGNLTVAVASGRFLIVGPQSAEPAVVEQPQDYALTRAFPNPFNRSLTIEYVLPSNGNVKLDVFNLAGRHVATLVNGVQQGGLHSQVWEPDNVGGGVYIIRLQAGGRTFHQKAIYTP